MRTRLFRTTALRLALRYALVYAAILAAALALFTWITHHYTDAGVEEALLDDVAELTAIYRDGGPAALESVLAGAKVETVGDGENGDDEPRRFYLLVDAAGGIVSGNLMEPPVDRDEAPDPGAVESVWIEEENLPRGSFEDDAYLPLTTVEFDDGNVLWLAWGVEQQEALHELTEYMVEVLPPAMVLSLLMGIAIGRHILRRVETISDGAGEIMNGDLASSMPVGGRGDEFDALSTRLNDMLDQIRRLVRGMSEVTDNIAHDLRGPLTRLRNRLEITLLERRSDDEYRTTMQECIHDADSLIRTFNALLAIAQAEAGSRRAVWTRVDVSGLARDLGELYEPLAQESGLGFESAIRDDAWMLGSRHLLAQAIGNLLENAIKFTPSGGRVALSVEKTAREILVRVADTGPGVSEADWPRAQERFVRLGQSRQLPGNGLGLSLVRAVCRLHDGRLERGEADPGLVVTLRFARDFGIGRSKGTPPVA